MLHVHARYIRTLERSGRLKRKLEYLPGDKVIAERRSQGRGLTSPEFAVLISYSKIMMEEEILDSDLPDDPYLRRTLVDYFPSPLRDRYSEAMERHPLHREIVTNCVVNDMVNRMGTTLAFRIGEELGAENPDIARAYLVVREVFDLPRFWAAVEALRGVVGVDTQLAMMLEARKLAERASRWLLRHRSLPFSLGEEIGFFRDGTGEVRPQLPELLQGRDLAAFTDRKDGLTDRGVPTGLAEEVAGALDHDQTRSWHAVGDLTGPFGPGHLVVPDRDPRVLVGDASRAAVPRGVRH
jgi:glutamate dehydrogenase